MSNFPPQLSHEEMKKNKIPLEYRDRCAGLLVPLKKCRQENLYMPWTCSEERHSYEKCQYEDFKRRVKEMEALKAAQE
ncbi:CYFA0S01e08218g1_1 [Cyberlindnera fabianii]|uniref:NADH dehydrogenase [ubiquinone] 1 beta subcomplex subunit 7 n=1 Tax=Cyberlindnera fabianii TaxID=36022 RepID=A0A061AP88_CYBFA|nr:NADH dehydrogenase [ubiquinone] 1 beta subcomplex subunit 7 [Cyberlindnera fabianii]CDR37186.1 CYFA0S01e08218g1_1 [Cyberlindnera fabianii]